MWGGLGVVSGQPVERLYREIRALRIYEGATEVQQLIIARELLKQVAPQVTVVLGGPEVSHEWDGQDIVKMADFVITGQGDLAFAKLCKDILRGQAPKDKIIKAENPELGDLVMPYRHYTQEDVENRIVYVEASRGCPFKCEFCLSALEKNARPFDLDLFLSEMALLHDRGVRHDLKKVTVGMNKRYTLEAAQKLRGSQLPILFTWAPGDRLFPIRYAERLASEVGNARIVEIADANTFVPIDQPQRLSEEIATFVGSA
jgi:radical SAM superfamily enzyme YgiQ (UPF0313 family)